MLLTTVLKLLYLCTQFKLNIAKMKVDVRELEFIRQNAPKSFYRLVAENLNISRTKVINELRLIKSDYDDAIIVESRRLLKVIKGLKYNSKVAA